MLRAYSLLELIFTLALMSFVSSAIFSSKELQNFQNQQKFLQESEKIINFIREARNFAFDNQVNIKVIKHKNFLETHISSENKIINSHHLKLELNMSSADSINFYSNHSSSPISILISKGFAKCTVIISLRGRIRKECGNNDFN